MKNQATWWKKAGGILSLALCLAIYGCGDNGTSRSESAGESGTSLRGNVLSVSEAQLPEAAVKDIMISIGGLIATTDEKGKFLIENIPTGNQVVQFSVAAEGQALQASETDVIGEYFLKNIKASDTIVLEDIEIVDRSVSTAHTGKWTGTAGSDDPQSEGQIAFEMIIDKNGNQITGTGKLVGSPDQSEWEMEGTENGIKVEGKFHLIPNTSGSECATGATFEGTFFGDTLAGTFLEVFDDPEQQDLCGDPETGSFSLTKEDGSL